ncbi:MAG TPA: hypothetical protein VM118_14705 [Acidobacteriota bacterium]|nr:hypothetical protein [Acidobacteriota bacterium]
MRQLIRWTPIAVCAAFVLCAAAPAGAVEFGSAREVSFAAASQWMVFETGDWVKVEKGRVRFHAADGAQRHVFNLRGKEHMVGTPGAAVVGILVYADQQPMTLQVVRFDLYDSQGQRVLQINKPGFSSAIVSPRGNAICGIDGAEGLPQTTLRLYDSRGRSTNVIPVEYFEGGRFSRDGSRFLFETAAGGLQVASAEGDVLYAFGDATAWDASADGGVVAVTAGTAVRIYRGDELIGTHRWPADRGTIRAIAVSPDGHHVAALSLTHAAVVSVDPPALVWDRGEDDPAWKLHTVDLLDGARLVAIGADHDPGPESAARHSRSRCQIIDADGVVQHTVERKPANWGAMFPQVRFAADGRRLIVIDRDAMTAVPISDQ